MNIQEKAKKVLEEAHSLAASAKSWTAFSNSVFGQEGSLVARAFPRMTERQAFYDSEEYERCNDLLLALMKQYGVEQCATQKSGKFVVRLPKTLHASLEVEASQEGVSLNQLALSKLAVRLSDAADLRKSLIAEAYRHVHDGYSTDRVIVHPKLNEQFLRECRRLGLRDSDYELNHLLQDVRKSQPALLPPATKKPLITDYDEFLFASEIAFRHLQRQENVSLDQVLCDPVMRAKFDEIGMRLVKSADPFKLRMGTLYLRKTHRLRPAMAAMQPVDLFSAGTIKHLKLDSLPEDPGMYVFYEDVRPMFAGETAHLRHRIRLHLEGSEQLFLPRWLDIGKESAIELRFHVTPEATSKTRLLMLNHFINQERPPFNYQAAA